MNATNIFNIQTDTASISNVGLVRKANEDSIGYAQTPNGHIFTVCDGMGGHVGGKEASSLAVESIIEFFSKHVFSNIPKGIYNALVYANKKIYEKAKKNPKLKGMGTTATIAVIKDDKIYIGHVGDSRIYLLSDSKLYHLTKDHSYVQELFNRNIISGEEMKYHSRKNEITRALGLKQNVEPDVEVTPLLLKNNDVLLLCTDGLSDMVSDEQIEQILVHHPNVKQAGELLLNTALAQGGKDNVSFQIIKITNSNYKNSKFIDKTNYDKVEENIESTLIDEEPVFIPEKKENNFKAFLINRKKNLIIALIALLGIIIGAYFASNLLSDKTTTKDKPKTEKKKDGKSENNPKNDEKPNVPTGQNKQSDTKEGINTQPNTLHSNRNNTDKYSVRLFVTDSKPDDSFKNKVKKIFPEVEIKKETNSLNNDPVITYKFNNNTKKYTYYFKNLNKKQVSDGIPKLAKKGALNFKINDVIIKKDNKRYTLKKNGNKFTLQEKK